MTRAFLLDEHFPKWWRRTLPALRPEAEFRWVGGEGAPLEGTKDPQLLAWCETNDHYLLTDNRRSMPRHLKVHLDAGRHVPGVFKVRLKTDIHLLVADIELVLFASFPDEFRDRIVRLPF